LKISDIFHFGFYPFVLVILFSLSLLAREHT
jgi:general stress protein CsbA